VFSVKAKVICFPKKKKSELLFVFRKINSGIDEIQEENDGVHRVITLMMSSKSPKMKK